ncbi:MAG TPA: LysM domain-containing protein [Tepidisphaeraceae bacterium]|nr:LysM domain-containing protein [Tepidisphaeraceae bacterium]
MKWILPALVIASVTIGCSGNKNKAASKGAPGMNVAALDVPAPAPAPAATFTPPQQPVVYDPAPSQQPLVGDAGPLDSADTTLAPESPAPRRQSGARKASAQVGGTRYKVKKGESLWSIAQDKYGNGNKWKQIAAANPRLNPDRVQAGQTIVLP